MRRIIILNLIVVSGLLFAGCTKAKKHNEKYYQTQFCNALDGVMEQRLLDRSRIDCLTDEYAIEVDFSKKWAESVGQSLYYAHMTEKKPAVGIIVGDTNSDRRNMKRLNVLTKKYGIKIFEIERIGK